ncbi:cilia- and flagella-associated protein 47 [Perognathus longimembris pacificus]|uniref:cilia- and flagella-associated protein 47 n=1 Tax=Perognathus longimembris pacificus TaxID=214514 RepID=UPI002019AA1B|nr:cilia- and flagella-associated protein 47 [Perognathus longimembris pacificus]
MDLERGSLVPRDPDGSKKEVQVRVTPMELKFHDSLAGRTYRQPITLHNLGRWNQKIRFQEPSKPQFKLMLTNLEKELASGLYFTVMVEYRPIKDEEISDQLLILAGNKVISIPLIGLIPSCQLEIDPVVDFGTLVADSTVYCKEVHIINHGKAPGLFNAEYQGHLPILISPTSGAVKAKSFVVIKVDFCANQPRIVDEVARVRLQGRPDLLLNIKVRVVEQIIELFNMTSSRKLECIRFGPVFFGTSKIEHAILHNNSPKTINWVAIMEDDSVGEELGSNIQERTDIALNNLPYLNKIKDIDVTQFITCMPNSGTLKPYEKIMITFCFSPKLVADREKDIGPSHRQDYALYVRFDSVGSKDGFLRDDDYKTIKSDRHQKVELALTGSGLPVVLQFDPGKILHFPPCYMGQHSDILCVVQNQSKSLPVMYRFQNTAHFTIDPARGKIDEGCIQNVICSFTPRQIGSFRVKQIIDIIGPVADEKLQSLSMKPFHQIYLEFISVCKAVTKKVTMKINPGLSPFVSNPLGKYVIKDLAKNKNPVPVAMLQSAATCLHNYHLYEKSTANALIAYPNDRSASIRPGDHHKTFRTIFTKTPRHNYIDLDYEFTDLEKERKKAHQDYYTNYIRNLRSVRLQKQAERQRMCAYNDTDIGLQPGSGLKSPPLSEAEIKEEIPLPLSESPITDTQLLSTKKMESKEIEAQQNKVLKGLKSEPSTNQEKHECSLNLTPKQIHQVIVGPSILNFGNICVSSTNIRQLHFINMLSMHVLVQLDINMAELQKTKQLSFVIPPTASTYVSMIFESHKIGKFWKSFTFTVNNIPGGHILVMAVIMPIKLELSSKEILLRPQAFLVKTCFRGTVKLYNRQNLPARFGWHPINTERGVAFSIRPASGVVDPYCLLECEVSWQPTFNSPETGEFILQVTDGNTLTLKCVAQLGHTKIMFWEPRVLFSNCPQGLTTWRKAILHNVGQHHAYFKVCKESLLPTLSISPPEGIIPFGGLAVLNISCTPPVAEKFDTRAKVAIHHANIIDLRISGSIQIADVEIEPNEFKFCGTYIGTTQVIPFLIKNIGATLAKVEFNLKDFPCFSMIATENIGEIIYPKTSCIYTFEVEEMTSLECGIVFSPTEVAAYDFTVQVDVNSFKSSELYTEYTSKNLPLVPKTIPLIPPCHVQATVLYAPLHLSSTAFVFNIPLYEMESNARVTRTKVLTLQNISKNVVYWSMDPSNNAGLFKEGIFYISRLIGTLQPGEKCCITIQFCPKKPGIYRADIPMCLNDCLFYYRLLCLHGEIKSPKLNFEPSFIFFTPVPLDVPSGIDINIFPQNYFRNSTVHFQVPTAKLLDDDQIQPFSVTFPKGSVITGSHTGINARIPCHLSFKSSKAVSFFTKLVFSDDRNNWFSLPVAATAENCILTIYPYLAVHIDKQKVILKDERDVTHPKPRSSFMIPYRDYKLYSSGSIRTSIASRYSEAEVTRGNLFVGMEIIREPLSSNVSERIRKTNEKSVPAEEKNEQFFLPEEGSKAHVFFQKIVHAAQNWFSLFGWPGGPHLITIPETVRRDVQKMRSYSMKTPKKYKQNDFSKYNKTIYDMIYHLSGRMPPGISMSQSLPSDDTERVLQLHKQHSSLLNFITAQGGCISHILPEFLFDPDDYKRWLKIMSSNDARVLSSSAPMGKCPVTIDMKKFEGWSKWAWTDVFLQTYKVLVLSRIEPHYTTSAPHINKQNSPKINPCFGSSNMYSNSERILLSWLNTNYENVRHIIWKKSQKESVPGERWIINFDVDLIDGLVFATLLGSYCPFLIEPYFVHMYTQPVRAEHYLHNCLIIVNSLREINFDLNIQATDICDPNPVLMLMLCVYMYERLPAFLPKRVVPFLCTLYDTAVGQILLKNPSSKTLLYTATFVGRDATDFSLAQEGNTITILPKNDFVLIMKFTSRFLHQAEASLLLISKPKDGLGGTTLAFGLKGEVTNFKAIEIQSCKTPCYEWKEITLNVKNHFPVGGEFSITLVESTTLIHLPSQLTDPGRIIKHSGCMSGNEYDIHRGYSHSGNGFKTSINSTYIREFFCSHHSVYLEGKGSSTFELYYLPFNMHVRYCAVILSNQEIGELVYLVEGKGLIPLPSNFLPMKPPGPIDYSNTTDEEYADSNILYLKCKINEVVDVNIRLPLTNEAKERALAFAARQQMSTLEYDRRAITGTLESSSVRVAIALLGLTKVECLTLFNLSKLKKPKAISYATQLSLPEYFHVPKIIYIPQIPEVPTNKPTQPQETKPITLKGNGNSQKKTSRPHPDGSVSVPLRFAPLTFGRYPCKILLTSKYDVRLYYVEGVVNKEEAENEFVFETPAFQALTQDIPIHNTTNNEWRFLATIEGKWFHGPAILHVNPGETVPYPLTFKPIMECDVMGKLTLQNEIDGLTYLFDINGIGRRPLAVERITIECQVGTITNRTILVPNSTKSLLTFKVFSDLQIVCGKSHISVEPDDSFPYILKVNPQKRGEFKGSLTFCVQSRDEPSSQTSEELTPSEDSHVVFEEETDENYTNFRIWYDIVIHCSPGPPRDIIEVDCSALETACIEIPLSNSTTKLIRMNVELTNPALSGYTDFTIKPLESINYVVRYSPATNGYKEESIIFQPKKNEEEFWFLLKLNTSLPKVNKIPEIKCDLGKEFLYTLSLSNPTHETLELRMENSNPTHFFLDNSIEQSLTISPRSTVELSVIFRPTALGRHGHEALINFKCKQFTEWKFYFVGIGLFPKPITIQKVIATLDHQAPLAIHFINPTKENILIDLLLTNLQEPKNIVFDDRLDSFIYENYGFEMSPLCTKHATQQGNLQAKLETARHLWPTPSHVHLSQYQYRAGIRLRPKGRIDVPVVFEPRRMRLYKTILVVQVRRANGEKWPVDNFDDLDEETKRLMATDTAEVSKINWMYPIIGLPQAPLPDDPPVIIRCQTKKRLDEKVVVNLTGEFFGLDPDPERTEFIVRPKKYSFQIDDADFSQIPKIREFEYEIEYENESQKNDLDACVTLYVSHQYCNVEEETLAFIFNLIFIPTKPLKAVVTIKLECISEGIWRFPLTLIATEPEVEDIIDIPGVGLFKESSIDFRVTSQSRFFEPFTAHFLPGSDPEFFVRPQTGKLPPFFTKGLLIVVGFKPRMYSKKYKATLVIQTDDSYWLYEINGLPPEPTPLINVKPKIDTTNKKYDNMPVVRRDFIRENIKLLRTGPSSTIKGAPLVTKHK